MRTYIDGDFKSLRVGERAVIVIEGNVTMVSEDGVELEVDDAQLQEATTVSEVGRRVINEMGNRPFGKSEPYPG